MPAAMNRPTRRPLLLMAFAALLLLAACTGQRDPSSWGDSTKRNFVAACDGSAAADEPVEEIREDLLAAAQPTEVCQCVIDELSDEGGPHFMEFSDFKAANSKRRDEVGESSPLTGAGFDEVYAACRPGSDAGDGGDSSTDSSDADDSTSSDADSDGS